MQILSERGVVMCVSIILFFFIVYTPTAPHTSPESQAGWVFFSTHRVPPHYTFFYLLPDWYRTQFLKLFFSGTGAFLFPEMTNPNVYVTKNKRTRLERSYILSEGELKNVQSTVLSLVIADLRQEHNTRSQFC